MAEMDRADRSRVVYDDAFLEKTLDRRLRNYRDRIQVAEEMRGIASTPASYRIRETGAQEASAGVIATPQRTATSATGRDGEMTAVPPDLHVG